MDGSALPAIDALPSRNAISEAPRAAGYRGSDFVLWHIPTVLIWLTFPSAIGEELKCGDLADREFWKGSAWKLEE